MLATSTQGVWIRKPVTVSGQTMINKLTRSSFDNMVLLIPKNFQFVKFSQTDFGIKTKHPAECHKMWRGAFRTQLSGEGVRLSRTCNSNLTTWTGETEGSDTDA